jgi:hypothetical protein
MKQNELYFSLGTNIKDLKEDNITINFQQLVDTISDEIEDVMEIQKDVRKCIKHLDYWTHKLTTDNDPQYHKNIKELQDEISKLKTRLPYFIASGICPKGHSNASLTFNGCVQIDIDYKTISDEKVLLEIKNACKTIPGAILVFSSITGRGTKVILHTDMTEKDLAKPLLDYCYDYVNAFLKDKNLPVEVDRLGLSQPCYFSHDPEVFALLPSTTVLSVDKKEFIKYEIKNIKSVTRVDFTPGLTSNNTTKNVAECLTAIDAMITRRLGAFGYVNYLGKGNRYSFISQFIMTALTYGVPQSDLEFYLDDKYSSLLSGIIENNIRPIYSNPKCIEKFGENCWGAENDINKDFMRTIKSVMDQSPLQHDIKKYNKLETLNLNSDPTGSGKTYLLGWYIINSIVNSTLFKNKYENIYVAMQDKEGMNNLYSYITDLLVDECGLNNKQAKDVLGKFVVRISKDHTDEIEKTTLVVISHHTYLSRKSYQNRLYSDIQNFINKNTIIFIDEAHAYFKRQVVELTSGGVYRQNGVKLNRWERITHCHNSRYDSNEGCEGCHYSKFIKDVCSQQHKIYDAPYELESQHRMMADTPEKIMKLQNGIFDIDGHLSKYITKTIDVNERNLKIQFYKSNVIPDYNNWLDPDEPDLSIEGVIDDIITHSVSPHSQQNLPLFRGQLMNPVDIPKDCLDNDKAEDLITWPYATCLNKTYFFNDTKAFTYYLNCAKNVVLLSATLKNDESLYNNILYSYGDINELPISEGSIKIPKATITVIKKFTSADVEHYGLSNIFSMRSRMPELTSVFPYSIYDFSYKAGAQGAYETHKKSIPLFYADAENTYISDRNLITSNKEMNAFITYTNSVFSVGANFPKMQNIFVECAFKKPANYYITDGASVEEVNKEIIRHRIGVVKQCAGRVLRGDIEKNIFLIFPDAEIIDEVVKSVSERSEEVVIEYIHQEEFLQKIGSTIKTVGKAKINIEEKKDEIHQHIENGLKRTVIIRMMNINRHPELREYLDVLLPPRKKNKKKIDTTHKEEFDHEKNAAQRLFEKNISKEDICKELGATTKPELNEYINNLFSKGDIK